MQRRIAVLAAVLALLGGPAFADGINLGPAFTPADLGGLSDALADSISFPLLGPVSPKGLTGFDLLAVVGGPRIDSGENWWQSGVDGTEVGGVLPSYRIMGRKGLPGRFDVGLQGGRVLGERFWSGEARWALLEGGVLEPGACVRLVYSRLENAPVDVEVQEVQFALSKGMTLVTPFAAVGYRRVSSSAWIGVPDPVLHKYDESRVTGEAGVRINLTVFRIVAEVRQGASLGYFVGVGVGL